MGIKKTLRLQQQVDIGGRIRILYFITVRIYLHIYVCHIVMCVYNIQCGCPPRVSRFFIIPSIISTGVCVQTAYNGARVLSTIICTARGCGSCVRDGPAAGQSRARAAYYICEHIARVSRQRVCLNVGADGERGKRII